MENIDNEVIINQIMLLIEDTSFDTSLVSCVFKRLLDFGYTVLEADVYLVVFSIQKVDKLIKNECNVSAIPEGLKNIAIDRVCGEVLFSLKSTKKLLDSYTFENVPESVKIGDTSISFGGSVSEEQRFDILINKLRTCGEEEFICYRKIKWT